MYKLGTLSQLICTVGLLVWIGCVAAEASAWHCSEAMCGPRVSKCMLIKSCNCTINAQLIAAKNCTCCKECIHCLGTYFSDCCSCVGLCPPSKGVDPSLAMKSYVDELYPDESERHLFELITADHESALGQWTVQTFPALHEPFFYKNRHPDKQDAALQAWQNVNCTVAYINECKSSNQCSKSCESMGATSYRWFHSGCCECVGDDCLNYGSRTPSCTNCKDEHSTNAQHRGEL